MNENYASLLLKELRAYRTRSYLIRGFVRFTPAMNKRKDEECMTTFLDSERIFEVKLWMEEQHVKDQAILPTRVVSMDVEELRVTHYDWMRMTGELPMTTRREHENSSSQGQNIRIQ